MSEPTPTANDGEDENGTAVAAAPAAEDVSPQKVVEEEKMKIDYIIQETMSSCTFTFYFQLRVDSKFN